MRLIIAAILILCGFVGCKENPAKTEDIAPNVDVLMPLSMGNTWISRSDVLDSNGIAIITVYDTLTIVRDTLIGNVTWSLSNGSAIMRNGSDGLYVYDRLTSLQTRLFQFPGKANDSIIIDSFGKKCCKLLSTSDTTTLNGRQYLAYSYKQYYADPDQIDDYRLWIDYIKIVPNIGIMNIEQTVIDKTNGHKSYWTKRNLVSFHLK